MLQDLLKHLRSRRSRHPLVNEEKGDLGVARGELFLRLEPRSPRVGRHDFVLVAVLCSQVAFDGAEYGWIVVNEVCAEAARKRGLHRLALLGTRFTMQAEFYHTVFARYGLTVVKPNDADITWVHDRYVGELLKGNFCDETREQFGALIARLKDEHGVDGVILGGTELPLLLKAPEIAGLPLLDTTALHVNAIVEQLASTARLSQR